MTNTYTCMADGDRRTYYFDGSTLILVEGLLVGFHIFGGKLHVRATDKAHSKAQDSEIIRICAILTVHNFELLSNRGFVDAFHRELRRAGIKPVDLPFMADGALQLDTSPYGTLVPGGMYSEAVVLLAWNRMLINDGQAMRFLGADGMDDLITRWSEATDRGILFAQSAEPFGRDVWEAILERDV